MNELQILVSGLLNSTLLVDIGIAIFCVALFIVLRGYRLFGMTVIPDDKVGRITKKFALKHLANGRIVSSGDKGLALELEKHGYAEFEQHNSARTSPVLGATS